MIYEDKIIRKSVLSALYISISAYLYLICSQSILVSSFVLSLGFFFTSIYSLNLFTDKVCVLHDRYDARRLLLVAIVNLLVIIVCSILFSFDSNLVEKSNLLVSNRTNESILTISLNSIAIGLFTSYIVKCNIEYLKYTMLYIYSLVILLCGCHFVIDLIAFTSSDIKSVHSVSSLLLVLIGNILGGILPNIINSKSVIYNDN